AANEGVAVRRAAEWAAGGGGALAVIGVGFGRWGRRLGERSPERAMASCAEALASAGLVGSGGVPGLAGGAGRLVVVVGDGLMGERGRSEGLGLRRWLGQGLGAVLVEPAALEEVVGCSGAGWSCPVPAGGWVGVRLTAGVLASGGTVRLPGAETREPRVSLSGIAGTGGGSGLGGVKERVTAWARRVGWNAQLNMPGRDERVGLGLIACGAAYPVLRHALGELNLLGRLPLLKVGVTLPIDGEAVAKIGARCERLWVLERGGGGLEDHVRSVLGQDAGDDAGAHVFGQRLPEGLPSLEAGDGSGWGWGVSELIACLVPLVRAYGGLPVHVTSLGLSDRLGAMEAAGRVAVAGAGGGLSRDGMGCPVEEETSTGVVVERLRRALADAEWMRSRHRRKPMGLRVVGLEAVAGEGGLGEERGDDGGGSTDEGRGASGSGGRGGRRDRDAVVRRLPVERLEALRPMIGQMRSEGASGVFLVEVPWVDMAGGGSGQTRRVLLRRLRRRVLGMGSDVETGAGVSRGTGSRRGENGVRVEVIEPEERGRYRRLLERAVLGSGVTVILVCPRRGVSGSDGRGSGGGEGLFVARGVRTRELLAAGRVSTAGLGVTGGRGLVARRSVLEVAEESNDEVRGGTRVDVTGPTLGRAGGLGERSAWVDVVSLPTRVGLRGGRSGRGGGLASGLLGGKSGTGWSEDLPAGLAPVHGGSGVWWCHLAAGPGEGSDLLSATLAEAGRRMGYRVLFREVGGQSPGWDEQAFVRWAGGALRWGGPEAERAPRGDRLARAWIGEGHGQVVFTRDGEASEGAGVPGGDGVSSRITPVVPRGRADLVLGASVGALAWALDGVAGLGVGSPGVSRWVVELDPTVEAWRGLGQGFDAAAVLAVLQGLWSGAGEQPDSRAAGSRSAVLRAGREAERRLGTRAGWGLVLLGYAWQRGWVPLTESALQEGVDAVWGSVGFGARRWEGLGVARASVELGRRWAAGLVGGDRVVGSEESANERGDDEASEAGWAERAEQWRARLRRSLGQPFWVGRSGRERLAERYAAMASDWAERADARGLESGVMRVVAERAGRCVRWGGGRSGLRLAKRYGEAVLAFAEAEAGSGGTGLSGLAAEGLASVMLVEDLVWTAGLAADRERWRLEWEALGVSPEVAALARLRHELWIDIEAYGLNVSTRVPVWPWVARRLASRRVLRLIERTLGGMGSVDRGALLGYERLMGVYVEGVVDRGDERWWRWLGVPGRRMPRGLAGRRLRARLIDRAVRAVEEAGTRTGHAAGGDGGGTG
ncbi:MAG: hypothetical protein AAGI68_06700, partial [Planctomycetota bacterium]